MGATYLPDAMGLHGTAAGRTMHSNDSWTGRRPIPLLSRRRLRERFFMVSPRQAAMPLREGGSACTSGARHRTMADRGQRACSRSLA